MDLTGQQLPSWEVESIINEMTPKVESYFGGHLLLLFFSIGCPGCVGRALPLAKQMQEAFPQLQILGIHTTFEGPKYSLEQVRGILSLHKITFPVFIDKERQTYQLFGAEGTPHWLWVSPTGTVEKSIFGSMGNAQQRLWNTLEESLGK